MVTTEDRIEDQLKLLRIGALLWNGTRAYGEAIRQSPNNEASIAELREIVNQLKGLLQ